MARVLHAALVCISINFLFVPLAQAQALKAENAALQDKFIVVKSVEAPADGWLVAHRAENGQPGDIIGFMMVKAGTNQDVQIPLAGTLEPGAGIVLVLHGDAGTMGTFDAADDKPVMEGDKPTMVEVKVE
jgi:hypothetical protein